MKNEYRVKYELSNSPVSRAHHTLKAAVRDLRSCQAAARRGSDEQGIGLYDYASGVAVAVQIED